MAPCGLIARVDHILPHSYEGLTVNHSAWHGTTAMTEINRTLIREEDLQESFTMEGVEIHMRARMSNRMERSPAQSSAGRQQRVAVVAAAWVAARRAAQIDPMAALRYE
jgi:ABC-type polar amino acid transport system ATPase subunit